MYTSTTYYGGASPSPIHGVVEISGTSFATPDLAGTWYFHALGDSVVANSPQWGVCTLTVTAAGAFSGCTCVNDLNATATVTGGALTIDSAGQVTGTLSLSNGHNGSFPHGKLDPSKSLLALVETGGDLRGLFLAIEGGGTGISPYTLNVTKAGTGTGTVTSTPAGIDCGSTCSVPFDANAFMELTATPTIGSTFTGWSGDADCSDGPVTMTGDRTCTATFTLNASAQILTVSIGGSSGGSVSSAPSGIICPSTCAASFPSGAPVTLTATPNTGVSFANGGGRAPGPARASSQ
jgi:hypothetical protein